MTQTLYLPPEVCGCMSLTTREAVAYLKRERDELRKEVESQKAAIRWQQTRADHAEDEARRLQGELDEANRRSARQADALSRRAEAA